MLAVQTAFVKNAITIAGQHRKVRDKVVPVYAIKAYGRVEA
jgi:hypothetical protein